MTISSLGVIGRSSLENERRVPIHPDHFDQVPQRLRPRIRFEPGYGEPFGVGDGKLAAIFGGVADRETLLRESDVTLLPKPLPEDLAAMRGGGVLWGWPHCVQQREITQVAIDRKLTLIAWESMFVWRGDVRDLHLFFRNNEMAGYCGVAHAMELAGQDGFYGPALRAVVLGFGSVSRGAVMALRLRGVEDILVLTQRPPWAVHDQISGPRYGQMVRDGAGLVAVDERGVRTPLPERLGRADVIVNGTLQDTDRPLMYLPPGGEDLLRHGCLIIDVSCDEGMGFPFARPTSFERPAFAVGPATYYAVNHTPTLLWRSASWELSRVTVPFLESVMGGPERWAADDTIRRAIEIRDGVVENPKILRFQGRGESYPHEPV